MTHDQLYRSVGVRKINQFINPNIILDTEMVFPKNSELVWFKVSDVPVCPSLDLGYLKNSSKPIIATIYEYKSPIGNFNFKTLKIKNIIKDFKKNNLNIKFLNPLYKTLKVSKNTLLIYNYGALNAVHHYRPNPMMQYHKWRNAFKTMTEQLSVLSTNTRHTYIMLEVPANIPDVVHFEKYTKLENHLVLEHFPTPKHLNLLEIWRYLTPELLRKSLLNDVKLSNTNNITLMFVYNNKLTLLNLYKLISAVREYDVHSPIQKVDAKTLRKMFLIFLKKLTVNGAMTIGELKNNLDNKDIDAITDVDDTKEVIDPDAILNSDFEVDEQEIDYNRISDEIMSVDAAKEFVDDIESEFKSLSDIKNEDIDQVLKLNKQIDVLSENKLLSKKETENLKAALEHQQRAKSPYGDGKSLKELLTITDGDLKIPEEDAVIPDINIIKDKSSLKNPIRAMDRHYIKNIFVKDITRTIYSIQNADIVIKDHTVEIDNTVLGGVETHTIDIKPLTGKPSKLVFKIPVINENGEFKVSGNTYKMRKQRTDKPIRKIDSNKVALTSYFGKSFITKADMKKDDIGFWFRKKLIASTETNKTISNVVLMPVKLMDVKVPNLYAYIGKYIRMFNVGKNKYSFDYKNRRDLVKNIKAKTIIIEQNGKYVIVGSSANSLPILMDFDNNLYEANGSKLKELPNIFEQLGIDTSSMPIETVVIKIFKKRLPIAILLSYYLGITSLLKLLRAKHTVLKRTERYSLKPDEYVVTFKDKKIVLTRNDKLATLIFGGFTTMAKILKDIDYGLLDKKESFPILFNNMDLSPLYVNEIKLMEDMFVDPITESILEIIKEPKTFKGLLIRAAELLLDNNYINPNNANGMLIKGYERVSGMLYTELIKSIRDFENKNVFSKAKITMAPFAVWRDINDDSTSMLVDNLNPIASLKQNEDVTFLGSGGRSKESMSMDTRVIHSSEIGVISEGVKDSGDVAVSAYMSASPKLNTVRGMVDTDKGKLKPENYLSTSALLAPASTNDDPKRLILASAISNGCKNK